jgi:hypothetical protein
MQTFPNALRSMLAFLWIGGLWIVGVLVPVALIHQLDGNTFFHLIERLFHAMGWVGIVAGVYILFHMLWHEGLRAFQTLELWLILGMLILTLVNQFAVFPILSQVKPEMHVAAEGLFGGGFQSWQTISSLIYLLQAVFGLFYAIRGPVK